MEKVFKPDTETIKDVSQDVRKAITVTLEENDKVLANLNDKRLEKMNERGILASYLLSPLSKTTNPEHTFQYTLPEDPESCRVSDVLINKTLPVTLYDNLLTFRDTNKKSELYGDLLRLINFRNHNVDLANLVDETLLFEFAKEMYFDRAQDKKNARVKSLKRLLHSPGIMSSGISTTFSPENPKELFD